MRKLIERAFLTLSLLGGLTSSGAQAASWEKLLTCDGGAAVIDVNAGERRNLQLVIREPSIIRYLNEAGLVSSRFGANEVILSGYSGHVDFRTQIVHAYNGRGVFSPDEFQGFIAEYNSFQGGRLVYIYRDGAGLKVHFLSNEGRTVCTGGYGWTNCGEMGCYNCLRSEYQPRVADRGNWYFQDCE